MQRVFLVLYALALILPLPALAARLQLEPVEIIGYQGDRLRLSVAIDCGVAYYGLLARVDRQRTLHLAAVVEQRSIVCTSLPEAREIVIDYLATRGVATITTLEIDDRRRRIQLAPITTIKTGRERAGVTPLSIGYEARCRSAFGTVVRAINSRHLEIGLAERHTNSSTSARCSTSSRIEEINSLLIKPGTSVRSLGRSSNTSLHRSHELRTAPIRPGSIRSLGSFGGVSVVYKRRCNEAPVGIVVKSSSSQPELGVVVAHYRNYRCPIGNRTTEWVSLTNYDLHLPGHLELAALPAAAIPLQITTPARYRRQPSGLSLRYIDTCSQILGVLYTQDAKGKLAVGVVSPVAASSCKGQTTEVSLLQPFVGKHVLTQDLAPLKLKG